MPAYIVRRLLSGLAMLFAITLATFAVFRLIPLPYPVRLPLVPMTRWHGTTMATGFAPLAKPTARTDFGRPS